MVVNGGSHSVALFELPCRFNPRVTEGGGWLCRGKAGSATATTIACTGFSACDEPFDRFPTVLCPFLLLIMVFARYDFAF